MDWEREFERRERYESAERQTVNSDELCSETELFFKSDSRDEKIHVRIKWDRKGNDNDGERERKEKQGWQMW